MWIYYMIANYSHCLIDGIEYMIAYELVPLNFIQSPGPLPELEISIEEIGQN